MRAGLFGPVDSDPTVSRPIDTLAASGEKALQAIRSARSEVRNRVWSPAGENAPDANGLGVPPLGESRSISTASW